MIIIDWLSVENHSSFNESLISALGISKMRLYVFSSCLLIEGQDNILMPSDGNRLRRALAVFKICWMNRQDSILLLTFDPLFAPLIKIFCSRIFVYEHNTTPERPGLSKHAVWQRLFCRSLVRLAQFPNQMDVLLKLGQNCFYLGSPLRRDALGSNGGVRTVFLAPSWRFQTNELLKISDILGKREVVIKRGSLSEAELGALSKELIISPLDWIDLNEILPRTIAIVVTISSTTRGSGWFNEAIRCGIPLIITNPDVQVIFRTTFPGYPFIDPLITRSAVEIESQLRAIRDFPHGEYVDNYNKEFRRRFLQLVPER